VIFLTDLTPLIFILALTNKNGFKNIKNAFEAADGFTTKINNMTSMMSMLPKMTGLLNNFTQQNDQANFTQNTILIMSICIRLVNFM
jgi:hypothetical protein